MTALGLPSAERPTSIYRHAAEPNTLSREDDCMRPDDPPENIRRDLEWVGGDPCQSSV